MRGKSVSPMPRRHCTFRGALLPGRNELKMTALRFSSPPPVISASWPLRKSRTTAMGTGMVKSAARALVRKRRMADFNTPMSR